MKAVRFFVYKEKKMKKYKRVCIVGNSGAGKSTLSVKLGEMFHLPVCHIDKLYWLPGWVKRPKNEYQALLENVIRQDEWIIDGNNKSTMPQRFERSDLIIFLDYHPFFCCYRAVKRMLLTVSRPDMADGCRERFNMPFYQWILGYRKHVNPVVLEYLEKHGKSADIFILKNPKELACFMNQLQC